jgi:hypothetical protein
MVEALGGRGRTPVRATFDGVPYRGSIVRMGDGFVLGVKGAIMAEAGVSPGDPPTARSTPDRSRRRNGRRHVPGGWPRSWRRWSTA